MIQRFMFDEIKAIAFLHPADRQGRQVVAFEHDDLFGSPVVSRLMIDRHGVYCPACGQAVDYLVHHAGGRGLCCSACNPVAPVAEEAA